MKLGYVKFAGKMKLGLICLLAWSIQSASLAAQVPENVATGTANEVVVAGALEAPAYQRHRVWGPVAAPPTSQERYYPPLPPSAVPPNYEVQNRYQTPGHFPQTYGIAPGIASPFGGYGAQPYFNSNQYWPGGRGFQHSYRGAWFQRPYPYHLDYHRVRSRAYTPWQSSLSNGTVIENRYEPRNAVPKQQSTAPPVWYW